MQAVRPAAVAGLFYPDDPATLASTVDTLLANAERRGPAPKVLIAPHAGYVYSGPIAASAYVTPDRERITRVVLLGPAHRVFVRGVCHPGAEALATPLGAVPVDTAALARAHVPENQRANVDEHSLEVHLPFLRRLFPGARVIPVLVGDATPAQVAEVLDSLWGGPETLIVVSSDLSHYLPYQQAREVDRDTAARILALDAEPLSGDQACGAHVLNGLLPLARARGLRARELDLRSSGDTAGDRRRVVGYGAFALYEPEPRP